MVVRFLTNKCVSSAGILNKNKNKKHIDTLLQLFCFCSCVLRVCVPGKCLSWLTTSRRTFFLSWCVVCYFMTAISNSINFLIFVCCRVVLFSFGGVHGDHLLCLTAPKAELRLFFDSNPPSPAFILRIYLFFLSLFCVCFFPLVFFSPEKQGNFNNKE